MAEQRPGYGMADSSTFPDAARLHKIMYDQGLEIIEHAISQAIAEDHARILGQAAKHSFRGSVRLAKLREIVDGDHG